MAVTSQISDRPLVTMVMRRTHYVAMNFSSSGLKLGQHRACALSSALDLPLIIPMDFRCKKVLLLAARAQQMAKAVVEEPSASEDCTN